MFPSTSPSYDLDTADRSNIVFLYVDIFVFQRMSLRYMCIVYFRPGGARMTWTAAHQAEGNAINNHTSRMGSSAFAS